MIIGLGALGVFLLYFPLLAFGLGRRASAREWARLTRGAILAGATALHIAVFFLAAPTLFRVAGAGDIARLCDQLLGHVPHSSPSAGWGAASLLTVSLLGSVSAHRRTVRQLRSLTVDRIVGIHVPHDGYDLVLLPTQEVVAYSRDSKPGQVVISEGLMRTLAPDELKMLVDHEKTHLTEGHERWLRQYTVIRHSLWWLPGLSHSFRVARLALERVADEAAAGSVGANRMALAKALVATAATVPEAALAFNGISGLGERVAAMSGEIPPLPAPQRLMLNATARSMQGLAVVGAIWVGLLLVLVCGS